MEIAGLACPSCRGRLTPAGTDHLSCQRCRVAYAVIDGIPNFLEPSAMPAAPDRRTADGIQLSVVIPALDEGPNLDRLLPELRERLGRLGVSFELLVVDGGSHDATGQVAARHGATVLAQDRRGYGEALRAGFQKARGTYVITLDADGSHDSATVKALWDAREEAEVVVASRYVRGGSASMPAWRYLLSRILNLFFRTGLSLPVRDVSSGYRLYAAPVVAGWQELRASDFDVLEEILIRAMAAGYRVIEVPFHYRPRRDGRSHARVLAVGRAYLRTFARLWRLRNSIACADYDARAYDSIVPLQRYWQRRRYAVISGLARDFDRVLDVGCGSSRIIGSHRGMVGVDVVLGKLRYSRRYGNPLVQASIFALPFEDASFDCVICSEVIEHVPADERAFAELRRVLRPGGRLVLGTPDYDRWRWRALEWLYGRLAPGGYADEHITHYGRRNLATYLAALGFAVEGVRYVGGAEMIFSLRKLAAVAPSKPVPVASALRAA